MLRLAIFSLILLWPCGSAADPGRDSALSRVMVCKGPNALMEIYLPDAAFRGKTPLTQALAKPVIGYYALDLSWANKGKPLEPVKVSMTADGKNLIVDQYTRRLQPTKILMQGGVVDFDRRYGSDAKCEAFDTHGPVTYEIEACRSDPKSCRP